MSCACGCCERGLPCGCCEGIRALTPASVANPPGLDALAYRVGTHGTFYETMLARLTTHELRDDPPGRRPLQRLTARTTDDFSIALLDAWATLGDVLTFYQERIANEGYRRTAIERRSLVELGRLIGYELRPPISATAFLAFTIADDPASREGVPIPAGTRAQSLPPPGGLPASFETSEDVFARPDWNTLLPRTEQPQRIDLIRASFMQSIVLDGVVTTLPAGSLLLFEFGDGKGEQIVRAVTDVAVDPVRKRTTVTLGLSLRRRALTILDVTARLIAETPGGAAAASLVDSLQQVQSDVIHFFADDANPFDRVVSDLVDLGASASAILASLDGADAARPWVAEVAELAIEAGPRDGGEPADGEERGRSAPDPVAAALTALTAPLTRPPSASPPSTLRLVRDPKVLFGAGGDLAVQMLSALRPELASALPRALGRASLTAAAPLKALFGLSKHAQPFGATAPRAPVYSDGQLTGTEEWYLDGSAPHIQSPQSSSPHEEEVAALDGLYPSVAAGSWVVVERRLEAKSFDPREDDMMFLPRRVQSAATRGVSAYNMAASVTTVRLGKGWLDANWGEKDLLTPVRRTTIHVDAQPLTLAPEQIEDDVAGAAVTLDGVVGGLLSGRRLIVTGERTDIPGVAGVTGGELVMLAAAVQRVDTTLPGDTVHTVLELASPLSYTYKRATAKIWGNVARSTHGETHGEVLGGGDPAQPLQTFKLSLGPLTNLPAANALGAVDTLEIRVDGVAWHETDDLMATLPGERKYLARTDDDGATRAIFGGAARLPSGPDNVRAVYRVGSGIGGNVDAEKISSLLTRPLGLRDVVNPLPATGGADREGIASARQSLPLAVMALDRLVSVRDYSDFARARAGIGKASATRISDGRQQMLHVTVAGSDDGPLDESSDLLIGLREALFALGDPSLPVVVGVRDLRLIVLVAGVRVAADYEFSEVEPRLRAALLDTFGFNRRELGESVVLSKVLAAAQGVAGVDAVDVTALSLAPEAITPAGLQGLADSLVGPPPPRLPVELARPPDEGPGILPAQLAVFSPRVPDTLILHEGLP